jgi:hypothetical protein
MIAGMGILGQGPNVNHDFLKSVMRKIIDYLRNATSPIFEFLMLLQDLIELYVFALCLMSRAYQLSTRLLRVAYLGKQGGCNPNHHCRTNTTCRTQNLEGIPTIEGRHR